MYITDFKDLHIDINTMWLEDSLIWAWRPGTCKDAQITVEGHVLSFNPVFYEGQGPAPGTNGVSRLDVLCVLGKAFFLV